MDNLNYILVSYLNKNKLKEEVEVYESIIRDIEKILRERNLKYTIARETIIDEKLKDSISKDKIREKLSKLEKEFNYYANRNPYEFEDGEFDGEQCNDIAIKIGVLKELLEGE